MHRFKTILHHADDLPGRLERRARERAGCVDLGLKLAQTDGLLRGLCIDESRNHTFALAIIPCRFAGSQLTPVIEIKIRQDPPRPPHRWC